MPSYSPSRLSTFEACPLKYKLQYEDRIKKPGEGIEAFMGSRVHDVLQKLYEDLKLRKLNSLEELLKLYDEEWKKNWHDDVVIVREGFSPDNYYQTGADCIANYYQRYQPFDQATVLGIEKQLTGTLGDNGEYQIGGIADRIDMPGDGIYEIHDYKTSGTLPEQKYLDSDKQLALYHLMLKNIWDDVKGVELVWHYVAFDREMRSKRTDEALDNLAGVTIELIKRIEKAQAENNWPAQETNFCQWCDYPDLCPKQKHPTKVNELPVNKYLSDDGVKLVNQYAKWDTKKKESQAKVKEIEAEIEKIREAVIAYAKKQGYEVIKGSDHQLKVKFSTKINLPKKSEKERQELELILKDIGKWEEVSTLDTTAMSKIILEDKWDSEILDKIEKYYGKQPDERVSLSKSREE